MSLPIAETACPSCGKRVVNCVERGRNIVLELVVGNVYRVAVNGSAVQEAYREVTDKTRRIAVPHNCRGSR